MQSTFTTIHKLAAFAHHGRGGNPAGVVICDVFPSEQEMMATAKSIGFSETVFAKRTEKNNHHKQWRVRYFSPESEVAFCGHATIALGALLGYQYGQDTYSLQLNNTAIQVAAERNLSATLVSPTTSTKRLDTQVQSALLDAFRLSTHDIDADLPCKIISAGNDHVLIPLHKKSSLASMNYSFSAAQQIMREHHFVTVALMWRESTKRLHVRNAFAYGGVVEDPATGAAAAAIGGYLREQHQLNYRRDIASLRITQGEDMGVPCEIYVSVPKNPLAGVNISGSARFIR